MSDTRATAVAELRDCVASGQRTVAFSLIDDDVPTVLFAHQCVRGTAAVEQLCTGFHLFSADPIDVIEPLHCQRCGLAGHIREGLWTVLPS